MLDTGSRMNGQPCQRTANRHKGLSTVRAPRRLTADMIKQYSEKNQLAMCGISLT
jgi:hypothetical protein